MCTVYLCWAMVQTLKSMVGGKVTYSLFRRSFSNHDKMLKPLICMLECIGCNGIQVEFECNWDFDCLSYLYNIAQCSNRGPQCCREWLLLIKKEMMMLTILLVIAISVIFAPEEAVIRLAYHISLLTGTGWVMELLAGHPMHIYTELGVSQETFIALIEELCGMDHNDS